MQLSEWQLGRLRNALRHYHSLKSASDGQRFNWNDVAEAIDEYVGVRVPYESLRKFVSGVRQKDGTYKFQTPEDDRLKAIYDFVTHPEGNLLSVEELTEREFSVQAALRLLDFLEQDFDGERIMPPEEIAGVYYHRRDDAPFTWVSELTLAKPLENGVVKVNQVDRQYPSGQAPDHAAVAASGLSGGHKSESRHGGWGIMTPEDNFFIFLKEERVGRNRYYFTLASDFNHAADIKLSSLSFLHHDYPLEAPPENLMPNGTEESIEALVARNAQSFQRTRGV